MSKEPTDEQKLDNVIGSARIAEKVELNAKIEEKVKTKTEEKLWRTDQEKFAELYIDGYTRKEIIQLLEITESQVTSWMSDPAFRKYVTDETLKRSRDEKADLVRRIKAKIKESEKRKDKKTYFDWIKLQGEVLGDEADAGKNDTPGQLVVVIDNKQQAEKK